MLRDGAEPCGNGAAPVKTVNAPNRLIKRLLRQLLGNVLSVGQRKQIFVNRLCIALINLPHWLH